MNLQRETRGANNGLTKHFRCINARRDKFIAKLHAGAGPIFRGQGGRGGQVGVQAAWGCVRAVSRLCWDLCPRARKLIYDVLS